MKNSTRVIIGVFFLVFGLVFASCTSRSKDATTGSSRPVDSVIGSYTGTYHYKHYEYGSGVTYNYVDTSYIITVTLSKVSPDSFIVLYPSGGLQPIGNIYLEKAIKYSTSNRYFDNLFFYPSNDSFYAKIDFSDGASYKRYWFQTFEGKK